MDLSIEIEVTASAWEFTARNHGTTVAYGVTVDIEIADQAIHGIGDGFKQKSGTTCSGNIPGTTCISGVWTVGFLGAGEEREFDIVPILASGLPCCPTVSDSWTVPARAVIKNTVPEEEERFKGDNTDTGWMLVNPGGTGTTGAETNYRLEASVDNLLPDAGHTVKFTFKVERTGGVEGSIDGAKVRLVLDNGMGTPTATPSTETFATVTSLTRTWDWDFAITHPAASKTLEVSTTLDNPLPSGVARSDLCLTAELTVQRPDDLTPGDTTAEICFREDPVTLLQTGETHLFTVYPCVGVSTHPCSSSNTIEMVVNGGESARAAGIARDDAIIDPGNVIVQVKDSVGRVVTGSNLAWGSAEAGLSTSIDNSRLSSADWTHFLWKIASVQLPTGSNLSIHPDANRAGVFLHTGTKAQHPPGGLTAMAAGLKVAFATYIKFENLGTYIIDFTQENTHSNGTPDTADDVNYSDTGRYTFHVGPVAELEVQDNGLNPELAPTQRAFTIVAVNNGPDDAPAAQVTVTNLNDSDYVSHAASHGTFNSTTGVWTIGELREDSGYYRANGHSLGWPALTIITSAAVDTEITAAITNTADYEVCIDSSGDDVDASNQADCKTESSNTNVWHAEVCVNTANNEIDSNITVEATCNNTADRAWTENVCASSTGGVLAAHTQAICFGWHTTSYYDYISDNSTGVTIKAKDGTGAGLPALQMAQEDTASIVVEWDPVGALNGRLVTRYEIEWSTDGETDWEQLADDVPGPRYVDTAVNVGDTRYYRVRAVNDRGRMGPWSQPIKGMVPVPETSTATAGSPEAPVLTATLPEGADGRTQIDLGWEKPIENGAVITSYTLEVADRSNGPWAAPDPAPQLGGSDTSWSHEGLTGGARKYYRMKATNSEGDSDWSEVIDATTNAPGKASPPLNLQAAPDGDAAIDLMWDPPIDDGGSPIRYYEVQWSPNGTSGWSNAGRTPDAETRTFKQGGMRFGTKRYYRVAARNGVTLGEWSDPPVSATTLAGVPGMPNLTAPGRRRQHHRADLDRARRQRLGHHPLRAGVVRRRHGRELDRPDQPLHDGHLLQ